MERTQVLVTRTGAEGLALARKVDELGFDALHLPLVRLQAVSDPERVRRQFLALPHLDGLIVTSREGVRQAAALGLLTDLRTTATVVPGQGTRALALELGLQRVDCPGGLSGSSEAMLAMATLQQVAATHWLILAASDGRRLLDRTLQARGAVVHRLTVYRRSPEPPDESAIETLCTGKDWVTLLASGSALERLATSLPTAAWDRLRQGTMVVPSDRLQALASERGVANVIVSAGASDEAMLAALKARPPNR